jgi:hypothetical protein
MFSLFLSLLACYGYLNIKKENLQIFSQQQIFYFSFFHNYFLHVFSMTTFGYLCSILIKYGIRAEIGYYYNIPGVSDILLLFYLSKYYEFLDTMIIYAKGKDPIFLQKFHHVGAVIFWHLGYVNSMEGFFFATLYNSCVHTVMYMYYFFTLFPRLQINIYKYKVYITSLQFIQLFVGVITLTYYYYDIENEQNKLVILGFDAYILALLVLFGQFMVNNYFKGKPRFPF